MKNITLIIILLILSVLFVGFVAYADVDQVPAPFVDSSISRTLKDGTVQSFDGDEYAIVKRSKKKKVAPPAPVKEVETKVVEVTKTVEVVKEQPRRKHRVSLLAGQGYQQGLDRSSNGNTTEIESRYGMVYGLQYQYLMWERVSLGLELLNQKACLIEAGYDF